MKNRMYLVRNLFSSQTAQSISIKLRDKYSLFSIEKPTKDYFETVKKTFFINSNYEIIPTIESKLIFNIYNPIKSFCNKKFVEKKIEQIYKIKSIDELFITYPIHPSSYLYMKVAIRNGIKICLYEEGICFYRYNYSIEYKINSLKKIIKFVLLKLHGLEIGYLKLNLDRYSILQQNLKLLFPQFKYEYNFDILLLSRPMSDDYESITIEDEINVILRSLSIIKKRYGFHKVGIKFHPRDSEKKRLQILYVFDSNSISYDLVQNIVSSESVVFNMKKGIILGYETSTLFFANRINKNIKALSMLYLLNKNINDDRLSVFINEIIKEYKYIEVIEDE